MAPASLKRTLSKCFLTSSCPSLAEFLCEKSRTFVYKCRKGKISVNNAEARHTSRGALDETGPLRASANEMHCSRRLHVGSLSAFITPLLEIISLAKNSTLSSAEPLNCF
ncbi:hypothetical protein ACB098_08G020300 [Castanea mollissima]